MCWSGEASGVVAAVGLTATGYSVYKKTDKSLWMPLAYFSLMELIQAYSYTVLNQCNEPSNQVVTLLGWIHICFQPIFVNLISLYFIPQHVREKIQLPVFTVVSVAVVFLLLSMYPFPWAPKCPIGYDMFCGETLCSFSGKWHIAWSMPRSHFWIGSNVYALVAFVLPVLYGSWKTTLYHIVTGPLLAYLTSGSLNETAAVWCLYSIGLLLIVVKTPVRNYLHVKKWPLFYLFKPHQGRS